VQHSAAFITWRASGSGGWLWLLHHSLDKTAHCTITVKTVGMTTSMSRTLGIPAGVPKTEITAATTGSSSAGSDNSSREEVVAAGSGVQTSSYRPFCLHTLKRWRHASSRAQQLLADYYAGKLSPPIPAAADVVTAAASAEQYPWAKPEWGQYRQRAVFYAHPGGVGNLTVWAWDIVPEVGAHMTCCAARGA
jgi:hypothetical protein